MKFQNPSSDTLIDFATVFGGVVLGSMLSRGAVAVIHTPSGKTDAETLKKEKNALLLKRGAIIGVSGVAGASIKSTDTLSSVAKGVCYGMAGQQTVDLVKDSTADNTKLSDTSTKTKKFIAASLGLACPCDSTPMLNGRRRGTGRRRIAMRMPDFNSGYQSANDNPTFEELISRKQDLLSA